MKKIFFSIVLVIAAVRCASAAVDTNDILCRYISRIEDLNRKYDDFRRRDLPYILRRAGNKIIKSIGKAKEGDLLTSIWLLKNALKFSQTISVDDFGASLGRDVNFFSSVHSGWVANALIALVEEADGADTPLNRVIIMNAKKELQAGSEDFEDGDYKDSVQRYLKAVKIILRTSFFDSSKIVDVPVCDDSCSFAQSWTKLGQDLYDFNPREVVGDSVALSDNGRILAVGVPQSSKQGYVQVYRLDSTDKWIPMGQKLLGKRRADRFGLRVAMNGNGTVLAVGAALGPIQVFRFDSIVNTWTEISDGIDNEHRGGYSLSFNEKGDVLAHPTDDDGGVRVLRYNQSTKSWQQLGQILLEGYSKQVRRDILYSVSLSSLGTSVAVGAHDLRADVDFDETGLNYIGETGFASVYQFDDFSNKWIPIGEPIQGGVPTDFFANSVSLDGSGSVMVVGAKGLHNDAGAETGSATVFAYDGSTWTKKGQTLFGDKKNDSFGLDVSMSRNGNAFITLYPVQVFQFDGTEWVQAGLDIRSLVNPRRGRSVSMSANGTIVATGGPDMIDGGRRQTHSSVYTRLSDC